MSEQARVPFEFASMDSEEMIARSRSLADELGRRRSLRDFDDREIPRQVLENAIAAAGSAPSGANTQPWHFVVVQDGATKREIRALSEATESAFYEDRITDDWRDALVPLGLDMSKPFLEEASALIVVFRRNHVEGEDGKLEKSYYPMESVGIATGMLMTALHLSGLAMLTYTPAPMGFLRKMLERPESDVPFLVLAVGYPVEGATVPAISRRPPNEIATFWDPGAER